MFLAVLFTNPYLRSAERPDPRHVVNPINTHSSPGTFPTQIQFHVETLYTGA